MSGDHNMNQIREGYRHYDVPVVIPNLVETVDLTKGLTLEKYFAGLNKLHEDTGKSVKDQQVAGTHYQRGIQPWDIISEWELDFWEGNVLKYLLRWKHKDGVQDLKKAKHYLEYLIERELNDD
jgi:hypothetical protein